MATVRKSETCFSDGTRLKTALNSWAASAAQPAVFRVIEEQSNLKLVVRYGSLGQRLDEGDVHDLLTNPESLIEFARRFVH
jgi:hypothetical protein